jgi:hypothetical protein
MFTITTTTEHTYREGWGVSVMPIWEGEDEPERISDIEVGVTHITADRVRVLDGTTPCVPFDESMRTDSNGPWIPVENYRDELDAVNNDSHDLRDHWFKTEQEARDHASSVLAQWQNPQPWQSFVVTE